MGDSRKKLQKTGSDAVRALEKAWTSIRRLHTEVPEAVIVLLDASGRRRKAGHFAHSSWRVLDGEAALHEVAVSPGLFGDAPRVLEALLHG